MPRFFVESIGGNTVVIEGADATHIAKSLRMKKGEQITVCDTKGTDYLCEIISMGNTVECNILSSEKSICEPDVNVTLYQAIPKSDKLDTIVQKAVELGVTRIVPVLTKRCISRPDKASMEKKCERLSKIAFEAAKQSQRGIIPKICSMVDFSQAVKSMSEDDIGIIFYEGGGERLNEIGLKPEQNISIMVGAEGGFGPDEVELAVKGGIIQAGLGPRILRCETAPLAALSIIMNLTKNM